MFSHSIGWLNRDLQSTLHCIQALEILSIPSVTLIPYISRGRSFVEKGRLWVRGKSPARTSNLRLEVHSANQYITSIMNSRVLHLPRPSQNQLAVFVVLQLGLKLQNTKFWEIWTFFTSSTRPRPFYIKFTIKNRLTSDIFDISITVRNGSFLENGGIGTKIRLKDQLRTEIFVVFLCPYMVICTLMGIFKVTISQLLFGFST